MKVNPLSLDRYSVVFWDFDGVIKDSVGVKSEAFQILFQAHGQELSGRVRKHHEQNGGMSRFDKIPLYLEWAGVSASSSLVDEYCGRFAELVFNRVIESAWVPGVREYLERYCDVQYFVLLTATPQQEIDQIVNMLGIAQYFGAVRGAPLSKSRAIDEVIRERGVDRDRALMIGDSEPDLRAARENQIEFLLRRTSLNTELQYDGTIYVCDDLRPWTDVQ